MSDSESLQPGSTFAQRYRVDRLIGSGGFARVYRAVQTDLDRDVALKVLRPVEGASSESIAERFYREAKILSQLRDEHTITIFDYSQTDVGTLYMVSEYIEGDDLSTVLRQRGPLGAETTKHILTQVLRSLREAHAHGILHRDIKPSNILLYEHFGERDRVKLIDFGIAKSLVSGNPELTMHGTLVGTPRYMAPEQIRGEPVSAASDLFSLGLVLYEMLVGRSPFASRELRTIYDEMLEFRHGLGPLEKAPRELREIARRMLEPVREERFQTADEVLAALEGADDEAGSHEANTLVSHGFPLDFDREGATPSTELTAVDPMAGLPTLVDAQGPPVTVETVQSTPVEKSSEQSFEPTVEDRVDPAELTTQEEPPDRTRLTIYAFVILALFAAFTAWYAVTSDGEEPSEDNVEAPVKTTPAPTTIKTTPVESESVSKAFQSAQSGVERATTEADAEVEGIERDEKRPTSRPDREDRVREKSEPARPSPRKTRRPEPSDSEKPADGEKPTNFEAFDEIDP